MLTFKRLVMRIFSRSYTTFFRSCTFENSKPDTIINLLKDVGQSIQNKISNASEDEPQRMRNSPKFLANANESFPKINPFVLIDTMK